MKIIMLLLLILLVGCIGGEQTALKFSHSNSVKNVAPVLTYPVQLQVADRSYVESVLVQAFDANGSNGFAGRIQTAVYQRPEFGGACDIYESSDNGSSYEFPKEYCHNGLTTTTSANSNPMRYSWTMKICDQLVSDNGRFNAFMLKIFPNGTNQAPDAASITAAYGQFFIEEKPDADSLQAFLELSKQSTDIKTSWQLVITTLCVSPEWQVL